MGYTFSLVEGELRSQDEESVIVRYEDGSTEQMRIHEYGRVYAIPGLYEKVVHEALECRSPEQIASMLTTELADAPESPGDLRIFDVGAGNGVVAEELSRHGFSYFVGLDIYPEAEEAAQRDRPGLYADYLTADVTNLSEAERSRLLGHDLNAMLCVAALGFGDIPPAAFAEAINLVSDDALVVFTINEAFLTEGDDASGFSGYIRSLESSESLRILEQTHFQHRISVGGEPLHYVAVVARKQGAAPVPED